MEKVGGSVFRLDALGLFQNKIAPPGWTAVAFRPPHPTDILRPRPPMGPDFQLPQNATHPGFLGLHLPPLYPDLKNY